MHNTLVSLSSRLLRFVYIQISQAEVCLIFVNYCVRGGLIDHNISMILSYFLQCSSALAVVGGGL